MAANLIRHGPTKFPDSPSDDPRINAMRRQVRPKALFHAASSLRIRPQRAIFKIVK